MESPVIQLRLKGRLLQTLSFQGDVLRIGRMRENDIVISNASVSRFHAVLRRENGQVILEDLGSENGCHVNGTRVASRIALEPGDEILIGKHQLVLSEAGAEDALPEEVATQGKSDAWDASNTYFVSPDEQAKMLDRAGSVPEADLEAEDDSLLPAELETTAGEEAPAQEMEPLFDDPPAESAAALSEDAEPEPMEVTAEEPEAWTPGASDAAKEDEAAEDASLPSLDETSGESPFAFGIGADLASSERGGKLEVNPEDYDVESIDEEPEDNDEQAVEPAEPPTPEPQSPSEPIWYAGLIIQNEGKLERVISWDGDRLTGGRSRECEIFLDQAEISRRHVMFVREDERYEVRDLDSINGILVNGEKVRRRDLEVGDVVKVEGFELTFLLDRQPIASEIVTDELAAPQAAATEDRFNMTMIGEHLPISSAIADPSTGEEPSALVEEEAEMSEDSLFGADDAEKEELVEVGTVTTPPIEAVGPAAPAVADDVVTFELRVRVEDLPLPLRAALAEVDERDLRLPVELVLRSGAPSSSES
jgi:pSer/pThr/pTyr-binding forkhead associated (FHA) protein